MPLPEGDLPPCSAAVWLTSPSFDVATGGTRTLDKGGLLVVDGKRGWWLRLEQMERRMPGPSRPFTFELVDACAVRRGWLSAVTVPGLESDF